VEFLLYNEYKKMEFIRNNPKSFEKIFLNVFRVSYQSEFKYQKDLYDFSLEEIQELMIKLKSKSKDTARERVRTIYQYIQHFKHLRKDRDNPLYKVTASWRNQFVESSRNIISEDDFEEKLSKVVNAQDRVVFRLVFEGVHGANYSELLSLKKDDIDWSTNTLRVMDSLKGPREVKVSNKCMVLIKEAIEQTEQFRNDGNGYHKFRYYVDPEYVIKRAGANIKETRSKTLFHTRTKLLKEITNNKDMTLKVLQYSGMARKAIEVSRNYNVTLEKFDFGIHWTEVAKQFNLTPTTYKGYVHYKTIWKHFSSNNCKDIKELYGDFEEYKIENFEIVAEDEGAEILNSSEFNEEFSLVDSTETEYITSKRKRRVDAPIFRDKAFSAYNNQCAITGETFPGILEACHIQPYVNKKSNHIQNSIILRIDIHELFDSGYITIDENYIVKVSSELKSDYYQLFDGKMIYLPNDPHYQPSKEALLYNKSIFKNEKVVTQ
jgi:integrase